MYTCINIRNSESPKMTCFYRIWPSHVTLRAQTKFSLSDHVMCPFNDIGSAKDRKRMGTRPRIHLHVAICFTLIMILSTHCWLSHFHNWQSIKINAASMALMYWSSCTCSCPCITQFKRSANVYLQLISMKH